MIPKEDIIWSNIDPDICHHMALLAHNNLMVAVYLVVFIHSVSPVTVSWWMSWRETTSCLRSRSRALRSLCVLLRSGTSPHAKEEREHTHSSSGSWYLWVDVLFTIFLRERNSKNSFIRLLVKQYASFTVSAHCNLIQYNMTATMIQHVSSFELKKKRHSILRPYGWAMGCLLRVFWRKFTVDTTQ